MKTYIPPYTTTHFPLPFPSLFVFVKFFTRTVSVVHILESIQLNNYKTHNAHTHTTMHTYTYTRPHFSIYSTTREFTIIDQ